MKILIVEDDFTSRKFLRKYLKRHQCDVAKNGAEAILGYQWSLDENKPYDAVFMDIHMPEVNGKEAVSKIRDMEASHGIAPGKGTKILMTSGEQRPTEVYETFKLGADAFLPKPVSKQAISEWFEKWKMEL